MIDSQHLLTFDGLILSDGANNTPGSLDQSYWFYVEGESFDLGEAEPVERTLRTLLQDGSVVVTDGADNRTVSLRVTVCATDSGGLALGEAALARSAGKATTLEWTPPDGWGETSVFEVFTSSIGGITDDLREVLQLERTYSLRLVCHPTTRAQSEVVTVATGPVSATPTTTTISDGSTTTNWSARIGTLTDDGDHLAVGGGTRSPRLVYTPPSPLNLSATPYLSLDMAQVKKGATAIVPLSGAAPVLYVNGEQAQIVAVVRAPSPSTYGRYTYQVTSSAVTGLEFAYDFATNGNKLVAKNLVASNRAPLSGTARQQIRTLSVGGSARTQGSLAIQHATSALGSVLAYTWPQSEISYQPPMRPYYVSGATPSTDPASVSGATNNLDTTVTYDIPVSALISGTHLLMARLASDTVGEQNVSWSAQVRIGSTNVGPLRSGVRTVPFGTTQTYRNVVLAREILPPTGVAESSIAVVRVTIGATNPAVSNIGLDEAWLFNTTIGALTWVECGTGTPSPGGPSNRLWLDGATTTRPRPTAMRGTAADRSDAFNAGADTLSWMVNNFTPGMVNVLAVTSGAENAMVSLTHYPRFMTHVSRLAS